MCVLFVYLVLAALYESWRLPLSVILVVPLVLLFAIAGVLLRGMDNNIMTQIGFIVLIGLACKNAILIVEFAKQRQEKGEEIVSSVSNAAKNRLRPILMTSFAFILGVVPLAFECEVLPQRVQLAGPVKIDYGKGIAPSTGNVGILRNDRRHVSRSTLYAGLLLSDSEKLQSAAIVYI